MRPLFEHYRDKRPVMAPDLPGFGLSDRPDVLYSSNMYSRWLAEWLGSLDAPADIVALSLTVRSEEQRQNQQPLMGFEKLSVDPRNMDTWTGFEVE